MTKFLLDSGDPIEYEKISNLARDNNSQLWGGTTNPSLIAKKLGTQKKYTKQEAFELQKQIVLEIVEIVPGAVSAEVYADVDTKSSEMIEQGGQIATWHRNVVVKLPTNIEGFVARSALRKLGIPTNNTLVFSQQQIFAICLHERLVEATFGPLQSEYPPFISPFVGRLDDRGENGMDLVKNGMKLKKMFPNVTLWMLEASVRSDAHIQQGLDLGSELITAPAKMYEQWFSSQKDSATQEEKQLTPIPYWDPSEELLHIKTLDAFMEAIHSDKLDINHPLTDSGLVKFAQDWNALIE